MKKTPWIWAAALLAASFAAQAQNAPRRTYIVQLADLPAAGYTGKVAGYAATKPAPGRRLDTRAAAVQSYLGYLNQQQSAVLAGLPATAVKYRYRVAFNGFAASLTEAEATALAARAGVMAVRPDTVHTVATSRTPGFLGLTGQGGLHTSNILGENVIIGVIDSGIAPEHPSFSDKIDGSGKPVASHLPGTVVYQPITNVRTWNGVCQTGPGFPATSCNNKLIGARAFKAGFDAAGRQITGAEFNSPRDGDGHGSHTASTAGGNAGAEATLTNGQSAAAITGMAPRARIASYKALWLNVGSATANGFGSDLIAAIDTAVSDGVDVINYSISGTRTNYLDGVEVAFLFAADAGVFVAASAGNDGPTNTVAHMSPWLTTVAASTMDRNLVADVVLGNGQRFTGLSVQNTGVPSAPIVLANDVGMQPFASLTPAQQTALSRCYNAADLTDASIGAVGAGAALDPAKVAGKIVVCDRGGNARVNKSDAVRVAGGVGMVQTNTSAAQSLNADVHSLPSVHLASTQRAAVRAYAAGPGATASLTAGVADLSAVAPVMAGFSSRGPSLASPNILKPDVTAPGVDVLAALVPDGASAAQIDAGNYPAPVNDFLSGTSMSSPHVAGLAALLRQARPNWTPAMMKSALMTTATGVKLASGAVDPDRFGYGAGHVNPNAAANPGLVYDAGFGDYAAFLCGGGLVNPTGSLCNAFGFLPAWNLNLASLTSQVVGAQTIRRTVTNVGDAPATYTAAVNMPGFSVSVAPSSLTLAPGASGSYAVQILRTTATIGSWAFGNLDWSDGSKTVRSPLTLQPLSLSMDSLVQDSRVRANKSLTLLTGYDGAMSTTNTGLVPAVRRTASVNFGQDNCTAQISVPAGTQTLRVAMYDRETGAGDGRDDLDLEVYRGNTLVGSSGSGTSDELVVINSPTAATYTVCVIGFGTSRTGVEAASYVLSSWVIGNGMGLANSLRVAAPTTVQTAGTGTAVLMWSVPAGQRYVGNVNFAGPGGTAIGRTTLVIDNQPAVVPEVVVNARNAAKAAKLALR